MQGPVSPSAAGGRSRGLGPSAAQLWLFLAVAVPAIATLATTLATTDLTHHIRAGQLTLENGSVLREDVFSFTVAGQPWLNQQWGAQVLLALAFDGGWVMMALLRAGLIASIMLLVLLTCRARGAAPRAAALLTLASFIAAMGGLALRPQLPAVVLFAAVNYVVARRADRPGLVWVVPALSLVWANVHGSFFLAPFLIGLAWIEDRAKGIPDAMRLLAATVASLAATLVNPFGARVWPYLIDVATDPDVTRSVTEWQPPSIRSLFGLLFYASLFAALGVFIVLRPRLSPPSYVRITVLLAMGLFAYRGIVWWAVAAPIELAAALPARRAETSYEEQPIANLGIPAAVVLMGAVFLFRWFGQDLLLPSARVVSAAPPGITASLRAEVRPGERLFASQRWGSWFELSLPDNPVFVDSRIEMYPDAVWDEFFAVSGGREGWQEILNRWDVRVVVAQPDQQAELIERIRTDPAWRLVYEDDDGVVLVQG